MKRPVPVSLVVGIALAIVAVAAYVALVRPQEAEATRLDGQAAELEAKIAAAEAARRSHAPRIAVADLFRLTKAMPDDEDMAGVLLEIDSVARSTGIEFRSIQPQSPVVDNGYYALPIQLVFEGSYYDLADFLYRLRTLVGVRDGALQADGRLYALDSLDLHEGAKGFPSVEAKLLVSAYGFGPAPADAGAPPAAVTTTTTETTTTGTTGTTTAPSEDVSAAGATTP